MSPFERSSTDWTPYEEQILRTGLAKRKHAVDTIRAVTRWSFEEFLAEARLLVWKGLCRWNPAKGATKEKWLAWQIGYAVKELERKVCKRNKKKKW